MFHYLRDVDTQLSRSVDYVIPRGNPFLTRTRLWDGTCLSFRESTWADVKRQSHACPWGDGVSIYNLLGCFCKKSFLFCNIILIKKIHSPHMFPIPSSRLVLNVPTLFLLFNWVSKLSFFLDDGDFTYSVFAEQTSDATFCN